jgi:hypothetical protein
VLRSVKTVQKESHQLQILLELETSRKADSMAAGHRHDSRLNISRARTGKRHSVEKFR